LEICRNNENDKSNSYFGAMLVNGIFGSRISNGYGRELAGLSRARQAGNLE
jgi:hypothetical protein